MPTVRPNGTYLEDHEKVYAMPRERPARLEQKWPYKRVGRKFHDSIEYSSVYLQPLCAGLALLTDFMVMISGQTLQSRK